MHVKHKSLIFVVEKNYPVNNNYMFKIDIKSIYYNKVWNMFRANHKDAKTFFPLLTLNMYLFAR